MSGLRLAVLVDPYPLWHEAVKDVLEGLHVGSVRTATTTEAATDLIDEAEPDLLVTELDFGRGAQAGIDFVSRARKARPGMNVIVLSSTVDLDAVDAALAAGAQAYVVKTADPDDIVAAVRLSFAKTVYLAPAVEGTRTPADDEGAHDPDAATDVRDSSLAALATASPLTEREREILVLVSAGHSNAQVARALWVAEQTVKFHLSNIYRKLGAANRTEASRLADRLGLLERETQPELQSH